MPRKVLNVGGGSKRFALPVEFAGWEHVLLDVDASLKPDVVADARNLVGAPIGPYDAVYCSHVLEHFYPHDLPRVLRGFRSVLKPDGFAFIRVPDVGAVLRVAAERGLECVLYESEVGPITARDVIYGHAGLVTRSEWQAHKTGFTRESLGIALTEFFPHVRTRVAGGYELHALASVAAEVRLAA